MKLLVTGSTGYIGGRLVPRLLEAGHEVRCAVRNTRKLEARAWSADPRVEVVEADFTDLESVRAAARGCDAGYWLVHSMLVAGGSYRSRDRELAQTFARAAKLEGVRRIIYLGGLGETGADLSEHLGSRREVEESLASEGVPVTTLRAAMIVGSGSASFEILRYLVERLPIMVTPRWVTTECQPIAVRDVLRYLVQCVEIPETEGRCIDVGGTDVLRYDELLGTMAELRGLARRWIIPVPVLTPRLSSLWIHLVTPISRHIARPLAEGLRNRVVCRDDRAVQWMPGPLFSAREAMAAALQRSESDEVETSWTDAGPIPGDPDWAGGDVRVDACEVDVDAPPDAAFDAVCRVGGGNGWYAADFLWRLRGGLDKLFGGPGLRRGRRNAEKVAYGEALDFWRVRDVVVPERLSLRAEMRLPGEALLEFRLRPLEAGGTRITQIARFLPKGLAGLGYWYAVQPLHGFVFRGMLKGIRRAAERGRPRASASPVRRVHDVAGDADGAGVRPGAAAAQP